MLTKILSPSKNTLGFGQYTFEFTHSNLFMKGVAPLGRLSSY